MDYLISIILFVLTLFDVFFIIHVKSMRIVKKSGADRQFQVACAGNVGMNVSYILMSLSNPVSIWPHIFHGLAICGTCVFMVYLLDAFMCWAKLYNKLRRIIVFSQIMIVLSLVFIVFICGEQKFVDTPIGTSYYFTSDWGRNVFNAFKLILSVGYIGVTIYIWVTAKKKSVRRILLGAIAFDITFVIDTCLNIFLSKYQSLFVPYNALLAFVCIACIYILICISQKNQITVKGLSEFIYFNMESPILVFDDEKHLILINRFATDYFNKTEEECLEKGIDSFFDIEESASDFNQTNILDCRCLCNNANCSLTINKIKDDYNDILGYMVFVTDQTERVKALMQAEEARAQAEEANRAKSDFLANMSHEIRTPINTIIGMDEMILRETKDKDMLKYAADIKAASTSLLSIINDILDFSKIESGMMSLDPVEYRLSNLLADEINIFSFKAKEKGLKFVFDVDSNLPETLIGDDVRVRQIITNLLSNAVKYTKKGRVMIKVSGHVVSPTELDMQIAVSDTGIGIQKDDIDKLFAAFTRVDMKRNRTIEGTGLGLNITHQLVHMMGGFMDVKSTYGKGSTFSCTFRQNMAEGVDNLGDFDIFYKNYKSANYSYHKTFESPESSILVVDDNAMNIAVIENLLKETKMNIMSVNSGEKAVKAAHDNYFDVILMDHMMPHMDGIEALAVIKADKLGKCINTPIVAMTANAVAGAKAMYLSKGFVEYVSKPVDPLNLERLLSEILPAEKVHYTNTKAEDWAKEDQDNAEELKLMEEYLEKKGINAVSGLRNMNGNITGYQDTLSMFEKSCQEKLDILKKYLNDVDDKNYAIEAHSLKGSAKLIGADKLADVCLRHEQAAKASRMSEISDDYIVLESEVHRTQKAIKLYLDKLETIEEIDAFNNTKKSMLSEKDLRERLDKIIEATEDYDHIEAKKNIESLMDFIIPEKVTKDVKKLYQFLEMLDYEKAIEYCDKLK